MRLRLAGVKPNSDAIRIMISAFPVGYGRAANSAHDTRAGAAGRLTNGFGFHPPQKIEDHGEARRCAKKL